MDLKNYRLYLSLLIFTGLSLALYTFAILLRDVFRLLTVAFFHTQWILSPQEITFYNLVYAFFSVLIAQSFAVVFYLDRPKLFFNKTKLMKSVVINNQRFLPFNFFFWFAKLALLYAAFYGLSIRGMFHTFSWYDSYSYLFLLFIIILFLNAWNSTNKLFNRHRLRYMFLNFVIISISALCLSQIRLKPVDDILNQVAEKDIHSRHLMVLPESDFSDTIYRSDYIAHNFNIVKNRMDSTVIWRNQKYYSLDSTRTSIYHLKKEHDEKPYWINAFAIQLFVHSEIKMKNVNDFISEASKGGARVILFAVLPTNNSFDYRFYQNRNLYLSLPDWYKKDDLFPSRILESIDEFSNIIKIELKDKDACLVNGRQVPHQNLKTILKVIIDKDHNYLIKLITSDDNTYSDFIQTYASLRSGLTQIRDEASQKFYGKQVEDLSYEEYHELNEKYGVKIIYLSQEFIELLNKSK